MEGHTTDFTEIAITVRDLDRELLYSQDKIGKLAQGMVVRRGGGWWWLVVRPSMSMCATSDLVEL